MGRATTTAAVAVGVQGRGWYLEGKRGQGGEGERMLGGARSAPAGVDGDINCGGDTARNLVAAVHRSLPSTDLNLGLGRAPYAMLW